MRRGEIADGQRIAIHLFLIISIFFLNTILIAQADALTVNVVGVNKDGSQTPVNNFRWVIEEDATYHVDPGNPTTNWAVKFHKSYMPVVAQGCVGACTFDGTATDIFTMPQDPAKHHYISVMPASAGTYSIGGAPIAPGQSSVTIYVHQNPIPTAQITIFVFEDNFPINNAPDLPAEFGIGGFSIMLEDAGGRYGISAGQQSQDAFGYPLGTEYTPGCDVYTLKDACVTKKGDGNIKTGACPGPMCGMAVIKNLAPGKYGISAIPPAGTTWQQTATIEGTKIIDAWVKANEPPFFQEFGPPGPHVSIGFIRPFVDATVLNGGSTIHGQIVNLHLSRPPDFAFYNGAPFEHTTPWVGLNLGVGGKGIYAAQCNPADGTFSIPNVPAGTYQLVVWDNNLDLIFAFHNVTVPTGGGLVDLGDVPVFQWFTRLKHFVFNDMDGNGIWDQGEMPMSDQAINIRWRDGTVNQSLPTDPEGYAPFDEVFPFFSWQIAEVDYTRFKATGVTVVVDAGGAITPTTPDWTFDGQLNPQDQDGTWGDPITPYRVEQGPVLTQAFQGFMSQTSVMMWGKQAYSQDENGGISGIVYYSTTRAEDDPRWGFAEPWEPGIPDVTVNLYDSTGTVLLATVQTDNWDANVPTNCPGSPTMTDPVTGGPISDPFYDYDNNGIPDCYDGMRVWNQVRPGVFDGGYAFSTCFADLTYPPLCVAATTPIAVEIPLPAGEYIVEVVPPPGYQVVQSQDKNVDFGDNYVPSPMLTPPLCAGTDYGVPAQLSLFPGTEAPLAGSSLKGCERKEVLLSSGANAAADFFLFTYVPIAGHIVGFILDDSTNEFDPRSPQFGEKYAPPWMPIGIYDWTGRFISQTYSDQWGRYNALVPSTYTANLPQPSGMSPNMLTTCMNDSNPAADPAGRHNAQYSTFCYTFQFMPGTTTYLDTPVIPVAAFAGPDQFPLDCEFTDGTPVIKVVNNVNDSTGASGQGPYVAGAGSTIYMHSLGTIQVANPAYCDPSVTTCPTGSSLLATIPRDYGFGGTKGSVKIGNTVVPAGNITWSASTIAVTVPAGAATGQVSVTRGDNGRTTVTGITLTVGGPAPTVVRNPLPYSPGTPGAIQAAIDAAAPGSLITVAPGTYDELVIMWKPAKLQGWGAGSTTISAVKVPADKLQDWRTRVQQLYANGDFDLLPSQEAAAGGIEPDLLFTEEGAGVIVLSKDRNANQDGFGLVAGLPNARIDGLTITSADHAGGIVVNGYAHHLKISNNKIVNNSGSYGGGIRIGHPNLTTQGQGGLIYQSAFNDNISIHNNQIAKNGGLTADAAGGISLCTGSDSYKVTNNFICGNFTLGDGGGIGHLGLSNNGMIANNTIIFNESFNQGLTVNAGGISIAGGAPLNGPNSLSEGSGSVSITSNLIQGNLAGAGDGGGIRTQYVNGQDVERSINQPNNWYILSIFNNMIVNNVAGLAGGGISLKDTLRANIIHNTIANNDSTATAGTAFAPGSPNQSTPQPAGVVSWAITPLLYNTIGNSAQARPYKLTYSNPRLENNIIRQNRSFFFFGDPDTDVPYGLMANVPPYWDLGVQGTAPAQRLNPQYCLLFDTTGYAATNKTGDPLFAASYFNGDRGQTIINPEVTTAIAAPAAFDEGGNFIKLRYGPLSQTCGVYADAGNPLGPCSNYHINTGPAAVNSGNSAVIGSFPVLITDYDGQPRPNPSGTRPDIGADEIP